GSIAPTQALYYDRIPMSPAAPCRCDGCGQEASEEHIARRLRRLEWATRFRPVHISVLFLGAVAPEEDKEFLYVSAADGAAPGAEKEFCGEGKRVLMAAGLGALPDQNAGGRAIALAEFQRRGYFLTHLLECPVETNMRSRSAVEELIAGHLP